MDETLYRISLLIALTLMLFFGFYMLLAPVPNKKSISNYLKSRRLMGVALLILAANYSIHLWGGIRFKDLNATILMNTSTYFLCYWLFSSALMTLLDKSYITIRKFLIHISLWLAYLASSCAVLILINDSVIMNWATFALAVILVIYGVFLSVRLLRTYSKAIKIFEDTHSDDIGAYIRWLSVFTYLAIAFGVSCALLTFLPDKYVFIWVLSAVPFYIYLYCCYQNYIFFYETVDKAIMEDIGIFEDDATPKDKNIIIKDTPVYHSEISRRIQNWIDKEGYRQSGITLNELAAQLCTNRTYLSEYINSVYGKTFRDWITDLRIEYAKASLKRNPQLKIHEISEMSGFLSMSHFSRTFSDKEGCSPARWRKENTE
ncbi:MAG: helix-turn-helix domain-containing protein [Candidatus Cryptobacteroides sp.]